MIWLRYESGMSQTQS